MTRNPSVGSPDSQLETGRRVIRSLVARGGGKLIMAAILFMSAGRLDWLMAWVYVVAVVAFDAFSVLFLERTSPDLIAERSRIHRGTKDWDKVLVLLVAWVLPIATYVVAGLDERFGWSGRLSPVLQIASLALVILGSGLVVWAMASNRFFSGVVRIQEERGHTVATGGPYRFVRHPGYVGAIIANLAAPLALGSLWALVLGLLAMCVFVVRTFLEDRTLQEELDGYAAYAGRVRYRLLPGVW